LPFDVYVIVSATHLDEDLCFLVTVFQSLGDQIVRFAIKNEMIEVVRALGDSGGTWRMPLEWFRDWVVHLKK
jgi:hypothetical protein